MDYEKILNNDIVICNENLKNKLLLYQNTSNKIYNVKYFTMQEIIKHLFFDYDKQSIAYLMNKYNFPYEVAEMYIKNMYYVEDKKYGNKLDSLVSYKKELEEKGLLIKDNLFTNLIKNKKLIVVEKNITKFDFSVIDALKKIAYVDIYEFSYNNYQHKVYEFDTIDKEVEFVAYSICDLINQGVDINKIKISNIDDDYISVIKRIFGYFNIPINLPNNSYLIGTKIAKDFLANYSEDISKSLKIIEKYHDDNIYNAIVDIVNKYSFITNYNEVKNMIIHDLSHTLIPTTRYKNAVEICDYMDAIDEYVFLLNFNLKSIPIVYKDEDYITDNVKPVYMDTTIERNIRVKDLTIKSINNIKNLVITYKKLTPTAEFYPSILTTDMQVERHNIDIYKSYSSLNDKMKLATSLDKLLKYGSKSDELNALKYNYDIPYRNYDNKYVKVSIDDLYKMASNKFVFSYSSMESYNECPFKYYLSHILKLDIYEENFQAVLGTIIHHILELGIDKEIDISMEVDKFISENYQNRIFSKKDTFFIEKAKQNLLFILSTIKKQMQFCKLNGIKKEEKVYISKDNVVKITFGGVIDKLLYREDADKTIVAVIDYKTGKNVDIDFGYMEYGIGLQLPIYLLLADNMNFKNVKFAGIYLQKVMPEIEKKDIKHSKEDKLKLEGYSNSNPDILKEFDITYQDSAFIKGLKTKTDGSFNARAKVLSDSEFESLKNLANREFEKCCNNVSNAKFDISPIRKEEDSFITACKYCNFKDICFRTNDDIKNIKKSLGGENNG